MQRDNQTKPLPARRWLQFSLRSNLLFTAASALLAGFVLAPRIRERAALDWLHEIDARVTTENIGPNWLAKLIGEKYLQTAVAVDLIWCESTEDDLRRLRPLRHLRRLDLSGMPLSDESLASLPLDGLDTLGLARCDITDAALGRLAEIPGLTRLRVAGTKVTLAAADRLADQKPDLQLDAALGDALYKDTWYLQTTYRERNRRPLPLRELIFRCQTAARWKAACADLKDDRDALANAYREQIDWFEKYLDQTGGPSRAEPPLGIAGETAWLECEIAQAESELARIVGDAAAEQAANDHRRAAARRLVDLMGTALKKGPIHPFEFERARETATHILLEDVRAADHPSSAEDILREATEQYQSLTAMTRALYDDGMRGGEAERWALVQIDLALSEVGLANLLHNRDTERSALKEAASLAKDVREAAESAYSAGSITVSDLLQAFRRADEIQTAQARAEGNVQAERRIEAAAHSLFAKQWLKVSALDFADLRWSGAPLMRCLYGIEKIEQGGRDFYEGPIRALDPPYRNTLSAVVVEDE